MKNWLQVTFVSYVDDCSKDPYKLGLHSVLQDCTLSVPPLADIDAGIVSRVLYGGYSVAGEHWSPHCPMHGTPYHEPAAS